MRRREISGPDLLFSYRYFLQFIQRAQEGRLRTIRNWHYEIGTRVHWTVARDGHIACSPFDNGSSVRPPNQITPSTISLRLIRANASETRKLY